MSSGARQVASFLKDRSRTEVVSGGASSASVRRAAASAAAPARPAAATEMPVLRKCRRFCMVASLCLEKASFRAAISGRILIRGPNVANGSLPAFPSVFASIGRLDARTTQQVDRGLLGTDQL